MELHFLTLNIFAMDGESEQNQVEKKKFKTLKRAIKVMDA